MRKSYFEEAVHWSLVVKPKSVQKLVDINKEGTKSLQTQYLNLVSKMQALLNLEGRNGNYRKDSSLIINVSIFHSWQIVDEYVHLWEKKKRGENTLISSSLPSKNSISLESVPPIPPDVYIINEKISYY